ncbi:MAG: ANTAR domain-containing protein [Betaproteobacteria bacterium]|nr:ANTAR domain-containing protein [Betaproteobacteria bacterium]
MHAHEQAHQGKLIDRTQGLLMAHQQLDEPAAHKALRELAMNQNKRMVDVAEAVLSMGRLLAPKR